MNTPKLELGDVVLAYALAAERSTTARLEIHNAKLEALPGILRAMGRMMAPTVEAAWLSAVEARDCCDIREIAVQLTGNSGDPAHALLLAIVDVTGRALALRDLANHHRETGTLPTGARS